MKTVKYISVIAMSIALLLSGCMKEDIDELRRQMAENAERIAALEAWQVTVNDNIGSLQQLVAALQDNDHVTGVVSFDTPSPGGYRVTFTQSGEITIWNGAKGETGAAGHSPVIGVGRDTDGKYYWTLDGEWLLAGGDKVPVTGENVDSGKSAYELAAENGYTGTLAEWLASLNGTNGVNGKSAYQQAVENGYTGSESEWLASLQGINGTNGKSAYELAVENGYTGTLAEWLASLNGTNGVNGKSAYEQAVENGYTGTLTEWLASLQGAAGETGATGANGATPKVAIGSDGYWYVSADGSAAGTPPGTGWESTGEKAQGEQGPAGPQGPQGSQGDAIFAANGVDYTTSDDYVVFTLADGTTITAPKYKKVGISFTQPGLFIAGTPQVVAFTNTGTAAPTNIRIVDLPAGWRYAADNMSVTITPPASMTADNAEGEATVLVGTGDQISAMYGLTLTSTGYITNAIGQPYYERGVETGWIYRAAAQTTPGLVISNAFLTEMRVIHVGSTVFDINIGLSSSPQADYDTYDSGRELMAAVKELIPGTWRNLSFFSFADDLGVEWFLPLEKDWNSSADGLTAFNDNIGAHKVFIHRIENSAASTKVSYYGYLWGSYTTSILSGAAGNESGSVSQFYSGRMYFMRRFGL